MRGQNSQDDHLNKMVHKKPENLYHVSVFIYCPFLQNFVVSTAFPEVHSQQDTKKGDITTPFIHFCVKEERLKINTLIH
jgi:hypothetical protein